MLESSTVYQQCPDVGCQTSTPYKHSLRTQLQANDKCLVCWSNEHGINAPTPELATFNAPHATFAALQDGLPPAGKLPKAFGGWLCVLVSHRFFTFRRQGLSVYEKCVVYDCPALQDLHDRYETLFSSTSW